MCSCAKAAKGGMAEVALRGGERPVGENGRAAS